MADILSTIVNADIRYGRLPRPMSHVSAMGWPQGVERCLVVGQGSGGDKLMSKVRSQMTHTLYTGPGQAIVGKSTRILGDIG